MSKISMAYGPLRGGAPKKHCVAEPLDAILLRASCQEFQPRISTLSCPLEAR
jgi:hypothetical protein